MGSETILYEIDPASAFFNLVKENRNAAEAIFMLEWRYRSAEDFFDFHPMPREVVEPCVSAEAHLRPMLVAIKAFIEEEPRLTSSFVDLHKSGLWFSGLLSAIAESIDGIDSEFAYTSIHGLHPLPSSATKDVDDVSRWIDTERCRHMAEWFSEVTESNLKEAYRKPERWPIHESIAQAYEQNHDNVHAAIRRLQKLYEDAGAHENIVVSQTS